MLSPLAPKVWLVAPEAKPRYPYSNSMYLEDDGLTVIDLGAGGRAYADLPCADVDLALLTHFHFDHVHCDSLFPQAGLMAGWQEAETYSDPEVYTRFHGYDLWEELMGIERAAYGQVIPIPDDIPARPGFRSIALAGTFSDNEIIDIGKLSVRAIHLPGHTAGHYGFYLEKEGILFSGDIDLVPGGPWYSSASGNVGDLLYSVEKIRQINPGTIVPSHRRVQTENIQQQLQVYIQVVIDREARIFDLLKKPQTLADLSNHGLVFPGRNNTYEIFWERMTIRNHLRHLQEQALIEEIETGVYHAK